MPEHFNSEIKNCKSLFPCSQLFDGVLLCGNVMIHLLAITFFFLRGFMIMILLDVVKRVVVVDRGEVEKSRRLPANC